MVGAKVSVGTKEHTGLPPLPLLANTKQQKIVDFAKIYSRSTTTDDVFESLQELAEELEQVAVQHREKLEAEHQTQESVGYQIASYQLQLLLSTPDNRSSNTNGDSNNGMTRTGSEQLKASKGKPLRRFLPTSISPFASALAASEAARIRQISQTESEQDALYMKVQQVPWEDDIVWGFEFAGSKTNTDLVASSSNIVEEEDETNEEGGNTSASTTTADASSRSNVSFNSGVSVRNRISESSSKAHEIADEGWVAYVTGNTFDMTKPRHYRWESPPRTIPTSTAFNSIVERVAQQDFPCPINQELESGNWINAIGWNAPHEMPESRLIIDENDSSLIFSDPAVDDDRPTLRIPQRQLSVTEICAKQVNKQRLAKDDRFIIVRNKLAFDDDNAINRFGHERLRPSDGARVVRNIEAVHHSLPAIRLSLTKPELTRDRLRMFQRPRGKFRINEVLKLLPPPIVSTASKEVSSLVAHVKKISDLHPTSGGRLILLEYTEQKPPVVANPGMACQILHYWRRPTNGLAKPPEMEMGQVITLGDHDESPFVGDVPAGRVVTSLNSKLFKVPIFKHKPLVPFVAGNTARSAQSGNYELFLLCRSISKSKKGAPGGKASKTKVYVFELPDVYTAGQIEPQSEVPAPNSRSANDFIRPYMTFHILRLFKKASDGERLKIEDISRAFPNQSGTAIRKRMKEVATFERGGNDSGWWKKKNASELVSEEETRASISPESVCLYESMMAGHRRLLDIGLTKLFTPTGVNGAINVLLKRLELRKQALSAHLVEPLKLERRAKEKMEQELWKLDPAIRKLETDIQVARFILEELQLMPWYLTNNYVECHLQGKGLLMLGGFGDPTGRGEGFSFVRAGQSRTSKQEMGSKNNQSLTNTAAVEKAFAAVTGTKADLRKLKIKEARDILLHVGVPREEVIKMPRWDLVGMIRELSGVASARGEASSLRRFVRGNQKSLAEQRVEYRNKCNMIYECQMNALSSVQTEFSSDEGSGDDADLDDLENDLLGDGVFGHGNAQKIVKHGLKNLFSKEGGGLNRSRKALEEHEDAVELERLMREMKEDSGSSSSATTSASRRMDVDTSQLRNQLRASGIVDGSMSAGSHSVSISGSAIASAVATPTDHRSRASSPINVPNDTPGGGSRIRGRKVLKRTTRVVEEDGTENIRIEFIVDDKQVARFIAKQEHNMRQLQAMKQDRSRKRGPQLTTDNNAQKRKRLQEELKLLEKTEKNNKDYQKRLERGEESGVKGRKKGIMQCTVCGEQGHIRTNRSCPLYMVNESTLKLKMAMPTVETATVSLKRRERSDPDQQVQKRKRM